MKAGLYALRDELRAMRAVQDMDSARVLFLCFVTGDVMIVVIQVQSNCHP